MTYSGPFWRHSRVIYHDLGNSRHTLSTYCGQYIRITSVDTQVYLSKKRLVRPHEFNKCLSRQTSDQTLQIARRTARWRNKCLNLNLFVRHQTQMSLILINCIMN